MKIIQLVSHQEKLYGLDSEGVVYEKKAYSYDSAYFAWVKVLTSEDVANSSDMSHKHHEPVDPNTVDSLKDDINQSISI